MVGWTFAGLGNNVDTRQQIRMTVVGRRSCPYAPWGVRLWVQAPGRCFSGALILAGCLGQMCIQTAPVPPGVAAGGEFSLQVLSEAPEPPSALNSGTSDEPRDALKRTFTGDKGQWIRRASAATALRFPEVDSFMWFNMNKERDWRVDSSAASRTAFRESFSHLEAGVFLEDYPRTTPADTTPIDLFEQMVGRHQDRVGWYEALTNLYPGVAVATVQARGSIPYIVWEPYDSRVPGETPYGSYSRLPEIAAGRYDAQILAWARGAASNGGPIEICFGHEMNGDWYAWGILHAHNGNTGALYRRAYRRVVELFDSAGATNVSWVWVINASWHDDFSEAFPGAEYVDRLGINGHNWGGDPAGPDPAWAKWREFENIFGRWNLSDPASFNNIRALAALADRPVMIAEFASAEGRAPEE